MSVCMVCYPWMNGVTPQPRSGFHFPDKEWEVLTHEDYAVRPGELVMSGTAKCRGCGHVSSFDYNSLDGYYAFPEGQNFFEKAWANAVTPPVKPPEQ